MSGRIFGFHDNSACAYYRVTLPLDAMRDLGGWEIATACGWDDRSLDWPLIVGQRIARPEALPLWRKLYPGRRLVYETDDDFWSIDDENYRALAEHTPSLLDGAREAVRMSHLATVSTQPLADVVSKVGTRTVVLENHIDGRLLDVERPRRDKVVIGWAGGDSHIKDMRSFAGQFRRFMSRRDDVELHNIGTDYRGLLKVEGRHTGWQGIWDYYRSIDFDIGLAPLAHLTFNNSKSHIKALEYAALGIPVIASDELPYRDFVRHGETGFLVKRDHEWTQYLRALVEDVDLRERMSRRAKEAAAEWTIQRGWVRWAAAYESLL
jgi:glycosyltransferase involved in cell wall biosynthesis